MDWDLAPHQTRRVDLGLYLANADGSVALDGGAERVSASPWLQEAGVRAEMRVARAPGAVSVVFTNTSASPVSVAYGDDVLVLQGLQWRPEYAARRGVAFCGFAASMDAESSSDDEAR